ncbi:hypothetical protein JKP88DRAFT_235524 [Tribonema minus]|uniref:Uncharacterized protein n=1 Tax=Tribonema minus TaxID=303371 RepID=A0A835ZBB0_9STRA|nr:hypothetical protein JKP88DRAFT_235524 [Tribonema minus]
MIKPGLIVAVCLAAREAWKLMKYAAVTLPKMKAQPLTQTSPQAPPRRRSMPKRHQGGLRTRWRAGLAKEGCQEDDAPGAHTGNRLCFTSTVPCSLCVLHHRRGEPSLAAKEGFFAAPRVLTLFVEHVDGSVLLVRAAPPTW